MAARVTQKPALQRPNRLTRINDLSCWSRIPCHQQFLSDYIMHLQRPPRSEQDVRVDLAAAFRLVALSGWDDTVLTHLSAALPGEAGVYLINEFGLGF